MRNGMVNLINELRTLTDAAHDEYEIGVHTYWSDDHLQGELDANRTDIYRERLNVVTVYDTDNNNRTYDYYWTYPNVETSASGTTIWLLQSSEGDAIGTASYTVNYDARHIRFTADTAGTVYFLTYRTYDMNRAAASVWTKKAANVARRFDVSTDNHTLTRSQMMKHYQEMATMFKRQAGGRLQLMQRVDIQ